MRHILFGQSSTCPIAVLVKSSSFIQPNLEINYVSPLEARGLHRDSIIGFNLKYDANNKIPVKFVKEYLDQLLPVLDRSGVKTLLVTDGAYFKQLTKQTKAEPHHGYVMPCKYPGYEHLNVILSLNYQALIYNPDLQAKLDMSLDTLASHMQGNYVELGTGIIHSAHYPETLQDIAQALESLHQYPSLTADAEAFSLSFFDAGVGTLSFAWDKHNGMAFACDYQHLEVEPYEPAFIPNQPVRDLIKKFLTEYQGEITWHNAAYDLKIIIFSLWMKHPLDFVGMLEGLDILCRFVHDTKIIAYLATNSTAGNVLGLKPLAHEFAGNWAKDDIKDIRKIPLPELLQYNLVDALSTRYVREKYYPIMVADKQEQLYKELMLPSLKLIIQMELCGMPMSDKAIQKTKADMTQEQAGFYGTIVNNGVTKTLNLLLQQSSMEVANAKLKTKQHPLSHFQDEVFNPNSGPQLQRLLYELMGLPVIDLTDTKQPATGAGTIEKLVHHTTIPEYKEILTALVGYGKVTKILDTFIPAFERGTMKADGMRYLHGSFNIGGTLSGRLSSNSPNLQNLPAGSTHGKRIKSCFQAPSGYLFLGADFNALEDRVNALLTRDPNKLKVFEQGYDSHCLRAFYFFPERLPGIVETVDSVNSIKTDFPDVRQDAKSPAFALQYLGTWRTLVKNLGFSEKLAKQVEANFAHLYSVSRQWVDAKIQVASHKGYGVAAFGLRIRTPLLKQSLMHTSATPREAEAEGRSLGNAVSGQSYGLLNNRAGIAFMQKVWASPYRYEILPTAMIHDAFYLVCADRLDVVAWINEHLPKEMAWQDLPELSHPTLKLSAEVDIHYKGWHQPITLKNGITPKAIHETAKAGALKYDSGM